MDNLLHANILVTGGSGFIGSNLVDKLLGLGSCTVVNIDALTYSANPLSTLEAESSEQYRFVHANLCDGSQLDSALHAYRPSAVFNLAAETHVDRSIDDAAPFIRTNVQGTASLLEACLTYWQGLSESDRDRFRLIHVSTDEVFGDLDGRDDAAEDAPYRPSSPYAASKAAADHLVRAWHRTYGIPTIVTHCGNNFGRRQFPEKLIPLTIARCVSGLSIPIYGDGLQMRDWLHVDDHVEALQEVWQHGRVGETYNISAENRMTNLQCINAVCEALDDLKTPPGNLHSHAELIEFVPDRPGHDRRYALDASRIRSELGWKSRRNFHESIRETVSWYLQNDDWCDIARRRSGYDGTRLGRGRP